MREEVHESCDGPTFRNHQTTSRMDTEIYNAERNNKLSVLDSATNKRSIIYQFN